MRVLVLSAAMLAAACNEGAPVQSAEASDEEAPKAASSASKAVAENVTAEPEPGAAPAAIPDAFHGVYDYIEGTCDLASDMRMEIAAEGITFYESVGEVRSIQLNGDDEIVVSLAMEGEGEVWEQDTLLRLFEDGAMLHVGDPAKPDTIGDYPRKRCEG